MGFFCFINSIYCRENTNKYFFDIPIFVTVQHSTKTYTVDEAIQKLERYCAYQDRCHKEAKTKLKEMRMIPEAMDQIIAHLIEENYLNEERFARNFTIGKFRQKQWGRNRITRELKQREISSYIIKSVLPEIEDEYLAIFDILCRKRLRQLKGEKDKYKKRKKFADYLFYRGWEGNLIYDKVKELIP